jgi:hypothetical protein
MAPQSSTRAQRSTSSGVLKQGTLSFASAKRSGSSGAKDSLKGKAAASSVEPPVVAPIRVGGKRKYELESEPEYEEAPEATEALERERLDTEDSRWNKAYGQARAKMGNLQPGPLSALSSLIRIRSHRAYLSSCARPIAGAPHLAHLRLVRSMP